MTRINIVPVTELSDQHLLAERKEMVRVPWYLRRSIESGKFKHSHIPNSYRTGTGHIKFFYDKGLWLEQRLDAVLVEMIRRGMNPNLDVEYHVEIFQQMGYYNDFIPSEKEVGINRERIAKMISLKPDWYRWTPATDSIERLLWRVKVREEGKRK